MARQRLGTVLQDIRRACATQRAQGLGDGEMLRRFEACQDQDAFAALVQRHGRLVRGVCRRVLGHAQDAEDACQAVFLTLARCASSIRRREALASWLGSAINVPEMRHHMMMRLFLGNLLPIEETSRLLIGYRDRMAARAESYRQAKERFSRSLRVRLRRRPGQCRAGQRPARRGSAVGAGRYRHRDGRQGHRDMIILGAIYASARNGAPVSVRYGIR